VCDLETSRMGAPYIYIYIYIYIYDINRLRVKKSSTLENSLNTRNPIHTVVLSTVNPF